AVRPSTMSARETAAFLAAATLTLLVAGAGVAAATSAPSAAQAGNTTVEHDGESVTLPASSNATLVGETTLEPGRSSGSSSGPRGRTRSC
ncbi:MAG: hypothetical protein V5A85_11725, partial [Haloarculaceae archaeon]